MDIGVGAFVDGKVILDRVPWHEGASVTVFARENRLDRWKYLAAVQIVTGTVVDGQVTVDADLMDGAFVAVLATDQLSADIQMTLVLSIDEGANSAEELQGRSGQA